MLKNVDCMPMLHWLFFTTTILFMLFSVILVSRVIRLRKRISSLIELLSLKEKELKEKKSDTKSLLMPYDTERSKSIVISANRDHKITYVNDYAEEIFGFSKEDLLGHDLFKTIYQENNPSDTLQENMIDRILSNPRLYMEHESENVKKNGDKIWISWTNRVVYDDEGHPIEIRSVGFDISKRKSLENVLHSLSAIDPATGVLNRQAILEAGVHELKRANRYNRQLSLLVMKLNCFQQTAKENNSHFTDIILREIIDICKRGIKESDIVGRIGDIEFAIILPETASENAIFLAEKLKQKIQEQNLKEKLEFFITADFGVASKDQKEETIDSLLQKAFNSLHQSEEKSMHIKPVHTKKGE